jgi:hypothetical protein
MTQPEDLRDWFAGLIAPALATSLPPEVVADLAYSIAEAMLIRKNQS